jgi:dTDP-4-dehydrorhamnose 3,5-epimerase
MKFIETKLKGAFVIELKPFHDHRGSFARTFCANEFAEHGLHTNLVQTNLSISGPKHTLRGMHYQIEGAEEAKLVRCIKGSILDTIIDLRKDSPTYCEHVSVKLTADNNTMFYVPEGFAHGFVTLEEDSHVMYQVSNFYAPGKERGIRWNDPLFNIQWGVEQPVLSEKDSVLEDYKK